MLDVVGIDEVMLRKNLKKLSVVKEGVKEDKRIKEMKKIVNLRRK